MADSGGWCSTPESCAGRAQTNLGSSIDAKTHESKIQDLNLVHGTTVHHFQSSSGFIE